MLRRVASANITQITRRTEVVAAAVSSVGGIITMTRWAKANCQHDVICNTRRSLIYNPRLRQYMFLYDEVFDMYNHYSQLKSKNQPVTKQLANTLFEQAAKLSAQTFFPLYESGDKAGCVLKDGNVYTPEGFKEAYKAFVEGGWASISSDPQYGGQGLPSSIHWTINDINVSANWPFLMYMYLTRGAVDTIQSWASEQLKRIYLPKLIDGSWSGTMCLTQPQCGTDLSQVKTRAQRKEDGTYRINGTKIFISSGDHDLTQNIIHIVLARLPNTPPTTKGLSLFLVPRNLVKDDGSVQKDKNVQCVRLQHKMGINANSTCQLAFDNSVGYLIGQENEGMKEMFTFMNGARIGVAMEGVAHAQLAFQNALKYARERRAMRSVRGIVDKDQPADRIIEHANVRHHILFAKAIAQGGRALLTDLGRMQDLQFSNAQTNRDVATAMERQIGFYTPIAKACLTEWGFQAASRCMQVWGGHGYIRDNGMEQIVRDARIGTVYEGTTGVQAMDFIGRKVLSTKANDEIYRFGERITKLTRPYLFRSGKLARYARSLWLLEKQNRFCVRKLGICAMKDRGVVGGAAQDFVFFNGYLTLAYYWLRMAQVAQAQIDAKQDKDGFYQAKVDTCSFVFDRILPRSSAHMGSMFGTPDIYKFNEETWDLQ